MTRRQEAKITMYKNTNQFLEDNSETITQINIPLIDTYKGQLVINIDAIETVTQKSSISPVPYTTAKTEAKNSLALAASNVAAKVWSYAIDDNNVILRDQMAPYKVKSDLLAIKDELISAVCANIYDMALDIQTVTPPATSPLIIYGIRLDVQDPVTHEITVPGTLTMLFTAMEDFFQQTEMPENIIEERKTQNEILTELFNSTDDKLKQLDAIIYGLKENSFSDFAKGYFNSRRIFGPIVVHTGIKGIVTTTDTKLPLQGVKVIVIPSDPALEPIITKTDKDGGYLAYTPKFKSTYLIKFSKNGHIDQEKSEVFVKRGKKTKVDMVMKKA